MSAQVMFVADFVREQVRKKQAVYTGEEIIVFLDGLDEDSFLPTLNVVAWQGVLCRFCSELSHVDVYRCVVVLAKAHGDVWRIYHGLEPRQHWIRRGERPLSSLPEKNWRS